MKDFGYNIDNCVAVDTEGTGINVWTGAQAFSVSMCWPTGETRWWEWQVNPFTRKVKTRAKDIKEIQSIVGDPSITKVYWNADHDVLSMEAIGLKPDETNIAEGVWAAKSVNNLEFSYRLKQLSNKYLDFGDQDEKDLKEAVTKARRIGTKYGWKIAGRKHYGSKPYMCDYWAPAAALKYYPELAASKGIKPGMCEIYGVKDAERTLLLWAMYAEIMQELNVAKVYEFEMKLRDCTMSFQRRGIKCYENQMKKLWDVAIKDRDDALQYLRDKSGIPDLNCNSPKQLGEVLFGGKPWNLPIMAKTKKGQPKTGEEFLAVHKGHPGVENLFKYRANDKADSTFFSRYKHCGVQEGNDFIVHPHANQWGTLTARYAFSDPNLQQVTDKDSAAERDFGQYVVDVRSVFGPRDGYIWYAFDYSQVEVIIFADISGEPTMLEAIRKGEDIHSATTNRIWGGEDNPRAVDSAKSILETLDSVDFKNKNNQRVADENGWKWWGSKNPTEHMAIRFLESYDWKIADAEASIGKKPFRRQAKYATFSKIFGGGPSAIQAFMGNSCTKQEAKRILNEYEDSFPEMMERINRIISKGSEDGFVTNPFGRRLVIDPWFTYRAVNYMVQSAAADLMKRGMWKCYEYLKELGLDIHLNLTIHDELIFEFFLAHAFPLVIEHIQKLMSDHEGVFSVDTPVHIDKIPKCWSESERIEIHNGKIKRTA